MSAATTRTRRLGRILATGAVAATALGLAPGVAAAAEPAASAAQAAPAQQVDPDTAASARNSWESRGRPHRMAIVRDYRIDLVTEGRITRQVGHNGGTVTFADLQRALPSRWLTVSDGTAALDATLVLVRGVDLDLDAGNGVHTLRLAGGADPSDAASIHTGGGHVTVTGITVTSHDPATGQPLPATAAGRPMLVASGGGRLDLVDATVSGLGSAAAEAGTARDPDGDSDGGAAVEYHTGSTGEVVRTVLTGGSVGLELARSEDVHLDQVTISGSEGDGLVLRADTGTTMSGIRAEGNGGNGVLVDGDPSPRPVTGIATSGNGDYGVALVGQAGLTVSGVSTTADTTGGLRISRSTDVTVSDYRAADQRMGVFTHVGSSGIVLENVHTTGGSRGLVVEKSTTGLEARDSSFTGAHVAGANIGGGDITLTGVQVNDSDSGVRVERGAHDIRLTGVTVAGGEDGVVTSPGTSAVVVDGLTVEHVTSDAVRTFSPGVRITGATITGGTTGIDVAAGATITDTTITGAEEGIHSRSPELVHAAGLTVETVELGVNAAPGSPFLLTDSSVHALESIRGEVDQRGANDLSLPPLNLLGAIGVPLILLAVLLEELHSARQRRLGVHSSGRDRRRPPLPAGLT